MGECEGSTDEVLSSILPCNIVVHCLDILC